LNLNAVSGAGIRGRGISPASNRFSSWYRGKKVQNLEGVYIHSQCLLFFCTIPGGNVRILRT